MLLKKTGKITALQMAAMFMIIVFAGFIGSCEGDALGGKVGDPDLKGTITINPSTTAFVGTTLEATYSGTEDVSYQWKKDNANVGTGDKFKANDAGSYTVTVSAAGYNSKTSTAVSVTAKTPQQLADEFTTAHAAILAKKRENVALENEAAVNAALTAYELLPQEAQDLLTDEKELLDNLKNEIIRLIAENFKTTYSVILAKTEDDVDIADKADVLVALTAYSELESSAQNLLEVEKTLLDDLLVKIDELELAATPEVRANAFKTGSAAILAKEVGDVEIGDESSVNAALEIYSELPDAAKALLTTEKALLDSLKAKIDALKLQALADAFSAEHAGILAKNVDTVAMSDEGDLHLAVTAYNALAPNVKALLPADLTTLFSSLQSKIDDLKAHASNQAIADAFKTGHSVILAKNTANVTAADETAVDEALDEYNALASDVKALLTAEKTLLDSLKARIDQLNAPTNYVSGENALSWGTSTLTEATTGNASVITLGLTPGNDTTEIMLNWYSAGTASGKGAHVRFIRGTFTSGTGLLTQDSSSSVASAVTGFVAHKAKITGLIPGASYQYAVSSDGTNWTPFYDFNVPAATGSFKFAVIADPQLNRSNVNSTSRYPTTSNPTAYGISNAAGWKATMDKIMAKNVSFIANCGDQVDDTSGTNRVEINATYATDNEYYHLFAPEGLRKIPFAPSSGNHDALTNAGGFINHYNLPNRQMHSGESGNSVGRNYFYRYNNVLFVVLDTAPYPTSKTAAQPYVNRFEATIQAAKTAHAGNYDWLIVQHHKSTASVASHLADTDIQYYVEAGFETIMSTHGVDFVIAGHDHVYARSYPLSGRGDGKVSVPNKTIGENVTSNNAVYTSAPGNPIYLTFTTASGIKYYAVSPDPYYPWPTAGDGLQSNENYPYLGEITEDEYSTYKGRTQYSTNKRMPVSNAAFVQPRIPSYCVVEVNGRTISFSTYAIASANGQDSGATLAYSFDADVPYDKVTVTKE